MLSALMCYLAFLKTKISLFCECSADKLIFTPLQPELIQHKCRKITFALLCSGTHGCEISNKKAPD